MFARPRRQQWRRRLETEREEVWEGAREREGRSGGWEVGPAGGRARECLQLPPASRGLQAAGRTQRGAIHSGAARGRPSPASSPEPRAPSERSRRGRRRLEPAGPGLAAARKAARAQQVESAPICPGKVSPAAAGGSWRGVRPLQLKGRGLHTLCYSARPAAAP